MRVDSPAGRVIAVLSRRSPAFLDDFRALDRGVVSDRPGFVSESGRLGSDTRSISRRPVGFFIAIPAFAVIISLQALVISGIVLYRTQSLTEASDPRTTSPIVVGAEPAPTSAPEHSRPAGTAPEETDGSVSTALPNANAKYTLSYEDIKLTLRATNRLVDLDQPLVSPASEASDLSLRGTFAGSPELVFDTVNVAIAKSPDATPNECAQDIQLSPAEQDVKLSQDLVLCVLTNGLGAVNEPQRAKMARIIVNSISKNDAVLLTVTTWEIPR